MPDPEQLAGFNGTGYVVAPAGFGKTHLIAASLRHAYGRQLVLTHTYAGVNALRRKARQLRVADGACRVDTIASWALRLCVSYSETSGWATNRPSADQWSGLYRACADLLDCGFIRRIVRASYTGMYVDEYQDCSSVQHTLLMKLARDLPCRILGDPLQGIFDFDGAPIDWNRDVAESCQSLGSLDTPHRWNLAGSPDLGRWLQTIRAVLENGDPIDLAQELPAGVSVKTVSNEGANLVIAQGAICRGFRCDRGDSVIAIHKGHPPYKSKCHSLAKKLAGRFVSIEEIEGKDLFSFVSKIQNARTDQARLKHACTFGEGVMTNVSTSLPAGTARGAQVEIRDATRNPAIARAGNAYLLNPSSGNLAAVLIAIKEAPDVRVARADLFNRAIGVLRKHSVAPQLTLAEAAEKYQTQFRYRGRPVGRRRLIGTTLLVKGLEFQHAIVLDAESLSRKELYVALTRGAKSLTIISTSSTLNPVN